LVERNSELGAQALKNYWDSLGVLGRCEVPMHFSTEFHFSEHKAKMIQWYPRRLDNTMQRTLNAVHKAAELKPIKDPLTLDRFKGRSVKAIELELAKNYIFNIEMIRGEKMPGDPVTNIISAGTNLASGCEVIVQILTRPVSGRYIEKGKFYLNNYAKTHSEPLKLNSNLKMITEVFGPILTLGNAIYILGTKNIPAPKYSNIDIKKMKDKINSGILFDTHIRIIAIASNDAVAMSNLSTMASAFATISDGNSFIVNKVKPTNKWIDNFCKRKIPPYVTENLLSSNELAYFVHFPDKRVPYVERLKSKKLPVPEEVLTYKTFWDAINDNAIPFGYSTFRGRTKWLAFRDVKMLRQHAYIIGGTGAGKSTMLISMALAVIKKAGLTFFDVKGTTLDRFIGYLNKSERERVVYVDLSSDDFFIPMNIMAVSMPPYDLANLIVDIFISAFGEKSIQARSQKVLRQAVLAVSVNDKNGTIMEVYRMFTDSNYRRRRLEDLERLYQQGKYTEVYEYWKKFVGKKNAYDDPDAQPIINKLEKIMQSTRPRMMLSQRSNVLNWERFMNEKKIVLINLNIGTNTPEIQRLFATMLMTMIRQDTFKRLKDGRHENDRETHVTILDEFEEFAKDPVEFERLLAMARECGNGLILTHQAKSQLPDRIFDIIADNTFTQVAMNIGDASAPVISKMFPGFESQDMTSFTCDINEGLEGVCRMKKLSPEPFTFYTPLYWKLFKDYGKVTETINKLHTRDHVSIMQCFRDIEARYKTTKEDTVTDATIQKQPQNIKVRKDKPRGSLKAIPGAIKKSSTSTPGFEGSGGGILPQMCDTKTPG